MEYLIHSNVRLGENTKIGEYVILGIAADNQKKTPETTIGDNAVIRSHTIIYAGNRIGKNFKTGHKVLIRENNIIGDDVSVGSNTEIGFDVKIGNRARIHSNVFIPEHSILQEDSWIGPNTVFTNTIHPRCPKIQECMSGPTIKSGAKIGANSTILPGVVVGRDCLVGAGSVVVSDVPDGKVVAGNPAKVLKDVSEIKCHFRRIEKPYK